MLNIFICEDRQKYREKLEAIINNLIVAEDYDMELTLSADNPYAILEYLDEHSPLRSLFFLDIDLRYEEMNGIALAAEIKALNPLAKIVFVTTHAEMAHLTFRYKVEAMDYIVKDDKDNVADRIKECIQVANKRYQDDKTPESGGYKIKIGKQTRFIPFEDIIFFETHPATTRKLVLHMENSQLEFYGKIKSVAEISPDFFCCHKSFVVNVKHVKHVNSETKEVEMSNGEIVTITPSKIKGLLKAMGK